jgi:hypothetical protein
MVTWGDLAAAEPDFAARVRATFAVRKHATLATLRRDGAPRISGTEVEFDDDAGQLVLGSMPGALKALDLRRDPRLALHSPTVDPPDDDPAAWAGEGKVAGRAVEVSDGQGDGAHRFVVDVTEVVLTAVGRPADHLVIESWHPGRGLTRHERR